MMPFVMAVLFVINHTEVYEKSQKRPEFITKKCQEIPKSITLSAQHSMIICGNTKLFKTVKQYYILFISAGRAPLFPVRATATCATF